MTQTRPADAGTRGYPAVRTARRPRRYLLPGLTAGALFLLLEMLIGAFRTTPWAFPEAVAHTLHFGAPGYRLEPSALAVGACVHLAISAALGALFTVMVDRLRLTGRTVVVAAWLFSGTETAVAIWGILHTILPDTLSQFLHSIPLWASILGHNVYGITLGLLLLKLDRGADRDAISAERG